jgi:hypothetical protein
LLRISGTLKLWIMSWLDKLEMDGPPVASFRHFMYSAYPSTEASKVSRTADPEATDILRAVSGLRMFSSTSLATGVGTVTREVMRHGAAVITKHEEPVMVLLSIERYVQLENAAAPNLDVLTREFDALYSRMQAPGVAARTIGALDLRTRRAGEGKRVRRRRA